jgi:aspartyl-tRNA(Asn)/glutamyl-tRNA(Gln) amidotransferase subunit A
VGIFARSVKDIALGLDATAGYDGRDPSSVQQDSPSYASHLDGNIKGLRLAVPRPFLEGTDSAVKEAFDAALKTLAEAGCVIEDLDIPELSYAAMTSMITSAAESAGINRRWFRERHQDFVPHVARGLAVGMTITASEYLTVQRARHRIRQALRQAYEKIDLIVSPTTPRVAPPISEGVKGNGDDTRHASYNHSNLLRFPSMLGLPGCSVPCGMSPDKMPMGMQLIGAWFADQTVLNAALAYQSRTEWHRHKPAGDQ